MHCLKRRIKGDNTIIIIIFSVLTLASLFGVTSNSNYFNPLHIAYGLASQMNSNNTNSLNIQNITAKKVHVGDIDIAYKTFGNGDPILLISGSGLVMDAWDSSFLKNLSTNHKVIIFDNRGVGNTTDGNKPFSISQFANDTVGLLNAMKIQKADILGFSMGSFVAQQLAVMHPEKVNRLILLAASCGGKENIPQSLEVVKILSDVVNNLPQDREKVLLVTFPLAWIKTHPNVTFPQSKEIISSNTLKQQFTIVEDWLATNWSGVCTHLQKISIPALVITGTEDVAVPSANSLIITQNIPGSWLVQIKGGGHGLMYQYPEKLGNVIQIFLTTTILSN